MQALSMDLRQRVVEAFDAGEGKSPQLAERFGVSEAWVRKLLQRRRESGSIAPKKYKPGPKPKLSDKQRARLIALAKERPSMTLAEMRRRLRLRCSVTTIWRALEAAGLSFKRRPFKLANSTATMCGGNGPLGGGG